MAKKITPFLLSLLVLTLGFGQLLRFEFDSLPLYLHDLLVLLLLLLNFRLRLLLPTSLPPRLFLIGLALGWVVALVRYPLPSLLLPSLYTWRLLSYLYLGRLLKEGNFTLPPFIFMLSTLTTALIGYLQYLFLPDMRWAQYLGWDDHLSRLTLPHYDPTFTAVMLGLGLFTLASRSGWSLPTLLTVPALLLTYARSVWLSLLVTLLVIIKPKWVGVLLCLLSVIIVTALPVRFGEGTNLFRTYSISSRLTTDLAYLTYEPMSLILGRGLNTLPLSAPASLYPNHATGPNNSYLYLLLTCGVLGLIGWGTTMVTLFRRSSYRPLLLFFFISSLFNNVMFYPFALLWVILVESSKNS